MFAIMTPIPEHLVSSAILQGSNLRPLLFTIYIKDLLTNLSCNVLVYANDLKYYTKISTTSDCEALQRAVINNCCFQNKIMLSINKCAVVAYTTKTMSKIHCPHESNTI